MLDDMISPLVRFCTLLPAAASSFRSFAALAAISPFGGRSFRIFMVLGGDALPLSLHGRRLLAAASSFCSFAIVRLRRLPVHRSFSSCLPRRSSFRTFSRAPPAVVAAVIHNERCSFCSFDGAAAVGLIGDPPRAQNRRAPAGTNGL